MVTLNKKLLETTAVLYIEGLGLCEHCQMLLSIENMPAESMDAEWRCPECNGTLTSKTFGYDETPQGCKKTQWVGPDKKWTSERPTSPFNLGHLRIETYRVAYFPP